MTLCGSWITDADFCSPCDDTYSLDPTALDDAGLAASEILYYLSGQQFSGECSEIIRPCSSVASGGVPYRMTAFTPISDTYDRRWTCGCSDSDICSCPPLSRIVLPRSFVSAVSEVKVDGSILATSDYRLDPPNALVSTTTTRFPCCQDLRLADTEPGTWSIAYTYGTPPPLMGRRAAATLACELYMACQPEDFASECRLPRSITSVARQGVTVLVRAITDLYVPHRGRPVQFGVPEIDMFLAAVNPNGLTSPSVFLSPDDPASAYITG